MNKLKECELCGEMIEEEYTVDVVVDKHNLDVCIWCSMVLEMPMNELAEHLQDKEFHDHYARIAETRARIRIQDANKKEE